MLINKLSYCCSEISLAKDWLILYNIWSFFPHSVYIWISSYLPLLRVWVDVYKSDSKKSIIVPETELYIFELHWKWIQVIEYRIGIITFSHSPNFESSVISIIFRPQSWQSMQYAKESFIKDIFPFNFRIASFASLFWSIPSYSLFYSILWFNEIFLRFICKLQIDQLKMNNVSNISYVEYSNILYEDEEW